MVGALYATVTAFVAPAGVASVKTTVEPETLTDETVTATPPFVTTKFDAAAVVAFSASLYVMVSVVPLLATTAELNTGAVWSTVELFVIVLAV